MSYKNLKLIRDNQVFILMILGLEISQSQMNIENKQAQMLFGVIGLFFFGHLFRIVLNVNDIYLFSFRKIDPATNCHCAAEIPLYAFVSISIYRLWIQNI